MVTESVGCMREKKDAGQYFAKTLTADWLLPVMLTGQRILRGGDWK